MFNKGWCNELNDETRVIIELSRIRELIFKIMFGKDLASIIVDETNEGDDREGVKPSHLLAAAVMGCLSSSFLFCIGKKNLDVDDLTGTATVTTGRDEDGYLRVTGIKVSLTPETTDPDTLKRVNACKKFFEQYCVVTESVRKGIPVSVDIMEE
ncbi:OsmC family peroxiredoxin [Candidatus Bathyarchaeota archaeon]|nr:OsmC family peroxiredoxin [Candidatus Bathyarchaeota archaeon]